MAVFWFISPIALPGVLLATLPLVTLWALRTMDATQLKFAVAINIYLLYNIIGFGNNTLFHALRVGNCDAFFNDSDYCKDQWITFLSFLLLCYEFATLTLTLGCLYVLQQVQSNFAVRGGAGGAGAGAAMSPQQESRIELLPPPQRKDTESSI